MTRPKLLALCLLPLLVAFLYIQFLAVPVYGTTQTRQLGLWLLGCCLAYGIARVATYHPLLHDSYHQWLKSTCWSCRQPLPFGEVHPEWMDLIVVVPMLIGTLIGIGPVAPFICVVLGYVFMLVTIIASAHCTRGLRVFWFLLGVCILASVHSWLFLFAICTLLITVCISHRLVMAKLSHLDGQVHRNQKERNDKRTTDGRLPTVIVGFPFDRMSPGLDRRMVTRSRRDQIRRSAIWSMLTGWLAFCVVFRIELGLSGQDPIFAEVFTQQLSPTIPIFGVVFAIGAALLRLVIYCNTHRSPLGIISRLRTGRLIIPEFDIVFVGPILTVAISMIIALIGWNIPTSVFPHRSSVVLAVTVAAVLFCSESIRPSYETWHFTGGHRLDPRLRSSL